MMEEEIFWDELGLWEYFSLTIDGDWGIVYHYEMNIYG